MDKKINIQSKLIIKFIILLILTFLFSFTFSVFMDRSPYSDMCTLLLHPIRGIKNLILYAIPRISFSHMNSQRIYRIILLFPIFGFIGLHFVFSPKIIWNNVYKYRWLIGLGILIFAVACRLHGDSLAMYNFFGIQQDSGNSLTMPIFGIPRAIRSDEYIVNDGQLFYRLQHGKPYGDFSLSSYILNPFHIIGILIYKTLGIEYWFSFDWYNLILFGFLVSFEFFMLITNKKKGLSLALTCMLHFSSFFQWWGLPMHIIWSQAAIVCFWYFFTKEKNWQKVLFLLGTGISAVNFVKGFYPAWQVPLAFISLILVIWVILTNKNSIHFTKVHAFMIAGAALFAILFVLLYIKQSMSYIESITSTVYPGHRYCNGGEPGGLQAMFRYIQNTFFAYKETENNCEKSGIISLFPLPIVLAVVRMIQKKRPNGIMIALLTLLSFLLWYIIWGIPEFLSVITLMRFSTTSRCVDIAGYLTLVILGFAFNLDKPKKIIENAPEKNTESIIENKSLESDKNKESDVDKPNKTNNKILYWVLQALALIACLAVAKYFTVYSDGIAGNLHPLESKFALPAFFGITFWLILFARPSDKMRNKITIFLLCAYSIFVGFYVRPISVGLASIYANPTARKLMEINEADPQKWISVDSWYLQSFTEICGCDTLNYVNTTPKMDLWHQMDPDKEYENVYNRYAHVIITLSDADETSFGLNAPDNMSVYIVPKDMSKLGVKYVVAQKELDVSNDYYSLEKLYNNETVWIYKIQWK